MTLHPRSDKLLVHTFLKKPISSKNYLNTWRPPSMQGLGRGIGESCPEMCSTFVMPPTPFFSFRPAAAMRIFPTPLQQPHHHYSLLSPFLSPAGATSKELIIRNWKKSLSGIERIKKFRRIAASFFPLSPPPTAAQESAGKEKELRRVRDVDIKQLLLCAQIRPFCVENMFKFLAKRAT